MVTPSTSCCGGSTRRILWQIVFSQDSKNIYLPACTLFWNLATPPSRGEACVPPLGSGWALVTALSSGRSDSVSLPRLGHKNAMSFHLVIWGHLVLEPRYQAVKAQTACAGISHSRVTCRSYGQCQHPIWHPRRQPASIARVKKSPDNYWSELSSHSQSLGLPSWVPKQCRAQISCSPCALSKFLTHWNMSITKWSIYTTKFGVFCYVAITGTGMEIQKGYVIFPQYTTRKW